MSKRMWMILLLLATIAAPATAGVPRLRKMVVVGDSLLAGFGSGGFVAGGRTGQVDSAPAVIARRAHVSLLQPLMTGPGVPPPYVIRDANHNGQLDPGDVVRPDGLGFRDNDGTRARNLAVPGETIDSVFEEISPRDIAGDLVRGRGSDGRDALKFLILGLPLRGSGVSQVSRAQEFNPSFILVWIGNNDILPMATRTNPDAVTLTAAEFGDRYRRLLNALADTNAGMAVANLPDPTGIAALRHAAGEVTFCSAADGTTHPVAAEDLLAIDLAPSALPVPPCGKVLSVAEQAQVRAKVIAFNTEIAAAIADVSANRGVKIAPVDMFVLFDAVASTGVDIDGDGRADLTRSYLGGLFSLDGVHPTRTGQALVANVFIDAIDARFGESIPRANVVRIAARDRLVNNRFRPAGEVPFGVVQDDGVDVMDAALGRVERGADHLGNELRDGLGDIIDRLF
jgi:lysophospholipase L1-like esterase